MSHCLSQFYLKMIHRMVPVAPGPARDTNVTIWLARKINFSTLATTMTSWGALFLSCIPWTTERKRQNYLSSLSVYPLQVMAAGVSSKNEWIIHTADFVVANTSPPWSPPVTLPALFRPSVFWFSKSPAFFLVQGLEHMVFCLEHCWPNLLWVNLCSLPGPLKKDVLKSKPRYLRMWLYLEIGSLQS